MIGVIVNPQAGYARAHGIDHLCAQILEAAPDARIHVLQPEDNIAARCRAFIDAGATCIAAAGGDGTVSGVAASLVGTGIPLAVIPAGTLNHFARDVGVGRSLPAALRVLAQRYVLPVDVAAVNGHIFLNNSSIGLYARMVTIRQRYEKRLGKWRALAWAAWMAARSAHPTAVSLFNGAHSEQLHTYLLFVGNNQYELNLVHLGQRAALDAGQLCCYILEGPNRIQLVPQVFHYLRETHPDRRLFRSLCASELRITPRDRRPLEVACDGEVVRLMPPLRYRVLPRALRVVVPEPPPSESREARTAHEDRAAR